MRTNTEPCNESLKDQESHVRAQEEGRHLHCSLTSRYVVVLFSEWTSTTFFSMSMRDLKDWLERQFLANLYSLRIYVASRPLKIHEADQLACASFKIWVSLLE
jgi:hypothetical protein